MSSPLVRRRDAHARAALARRSGAHDGTAAISRVAIGLLALPLALAALPLGAAAQPAARVTRLSAAEARGSGIGLRLVHRDETAPGLVEVVPQSPDAAPRLLAVAAAGDAAAVTDRIGQEPVDLTIVEADESRLDIGMPGLLAATFATDGSSLFAVDGVGRIWTVGRADGTATPLADGPFLGPLVAMPGGAVLALRVASVEAPFTSRAVLVSPDGSYEPIADEELVYAAAPLDDGSTALVAHRANGIAVLRADGTSRVRMLAELAPGSMNVAISGDGAWLAWHAEGEGVVVRGIGGRRSVTISGAANPRFGPAGTLLVDRNQDDAIYTVDGQELGRIGSAAGFIPCQPGCGS